MKYFTILPPCVSSALRDRGKFKQLCHGNERERSEGVSVGKTTRTIAGATLPTAHKAMTIIHTISPPMNFLLSFYFYS